MFEKRKKNCMKRHQQLALAQIESPTPSDPIINNSQIQCQRKVGGRIIYKLMREENSSFSFYIQCTYIKYSTQVHESGPDIIDFNFSYICIHDYGVFGSTI